MLFVGCEYFTALLTLYFPMDHLNDHCGCLHPSHDCLVEALLALEPMNLNVLLRF